MTKTKTTANARSNRKTVRVPGLPMPWMRVGDKVIAGAWPQRYLIQRVTAKGILYGYIIPNGEWF